jgi:hypothetical protein
VVGETSTFVTSARLIDQAVELITVRRQLQLIEHRD